MYKIADFNLEFSFRHKPFRTASADFFCEGNDSCATFICSEEEKEMARKNDTAIKKSYVETMLLHRKLAEWLPKNNAFVLHSACFDVGGVGVAFAAHSGTGKTTHMRLWQELLGDKMVVVNGDKPIVRFFDDEPEIPYAYGTPWNGKEHLGCNMRTQLKHICFIERSETNFVEKISASDAVERIMNQVYMPKDPIAMAKTLELINRLISSCSLWKIHCNMEPEAAKVAYNTIFGE